jgi:hypothetical protein
MTTRTLLDSVIYYDKGYIADLYEVTSGTSPKTLITRNQGKKAGIQIPVFSAEVSAQETRSFPISTLEMLANTLTVLEKDSSLDPSTFGPEMPSKLGWIEGELTVFKSRSTVLENKTGEHKALANDAFFQLRVKPGLAFALITTPEYFALGLDTLLKMQDTILRKMSIPVRALLRTFAAQDHMNQWIAVQTLGVMITKRLRALNFALLPAIDSLDMFIRLDTAAEKRFADLTYLGETYDRARASLMFFSQTSESEATWRNDAHLRAGLNEFYSLEAAVVRDLRSARIKVAVPSLSQSCNPLVHLMYILRHVGVHSQPVATGVTPVEVWSEFGGKRHEHSYGAVVLKSLTINDLLRSHEVKSYYTTDDLKTMIEWFVATQQTFGVSEVFRKGVSCYCHEVLSRL